SPGSSIDSFLIFNILCCRAYQKVSMYSRCDQHALSHLCRELKDCMRHKITCLFIQKTILSFSGSNGKLSGTDPVVPYICVNSCCIDYTFCVKYSLFRSDPVAALHRFYVFHLSIKREFHSVYIGVFCHSNSQLKGTYNSACRSIKHGFYLPGKIGFYFPDSLSCNDFQTFYSIFLSSCFQFFQLWHIPFLETKYQGSILLVWEIQFFRQGLHHFVSPYIHNRLHRPWLCIKAGMNNGAVGLGCATAYVLLPFQHQNLYLVSG